MRDQTTRSACVVADDIARLPDRETQTFPTNEIEGLTSPMRRAAVSVPSNIVEGGARVSQVAVLRFLDITFSSLRAWHDPFGLSAR